MLEAKVPTEKSKIRTKEQNLLVEMEIKAKSIVSRKLEFHKYIRKLHNIKQSPPYRVMEFLRNVAKSFSMTQSFRLKKYESKNGVIFRLETALGDLVSDANRFLECVELKGCSPKTVVSYGYDLLNFYTWFLQSKMEFEKLTEYDLYQYIAFQKEKRAQPRSINRRLSTVMQYWRFCMGKDLPSGKYVLRPPSFYKGQNMTANIGMLPQRRVQKLLRVKVPYKLQVPLSTEEVKQYLASIKHYRDLAIVYLMLHCGLRFIEILNLRTNDISILKRQLLVRGKGDKQRMVFLPSYVLQVIERYKIYERSDGSSENFFVILKGKKKGQPMSRAGLREIFRYRRKVSGVQKANPHRFRHTFAVDMIRAGVPVVALQKLMGHEDINMTMNYVNLSPNDVREEFLKASDRIKKRYG